MEFGFARFGWHLLRGQRWEAGRVSFRPRRFKTDIADMNSASEAILRLRPVTFRYKPEMKATDAQQFGLIAEEVAEVNPSL